MELVYLWVDGYKNIEKQGFNFSPRLECEFKDKYEKDEDGNEKLKDNCELIIKSKEHLKNFFSKNINITAIVGENGSGKSSLFEILVLFYSIPYMNKKKIEDNSFLIIADSDDFYYMDKDTRGYAWKVVSNIKNELQIPPKTNKACCKKFDISYFCNSITDMTNNDSFKELKDKTGSFGYFYNGKDAEIDDIRTLNTSTINQFNLKFSSLLQGDTNFFNFIDESFIFDTYNFSININEIGKYFHIMKDEKNIEDYRKIIETSESNYQFFIENTNINNHKEHFYKAISLYLIYIVFTETKKKSKLLDKFKTIIDTFIFTDYEKIYNLCLNNAQKHRDTIENFNPTELDKIFNLLEFKNNIYISKSLNIKEESKFIKNILLNELLFIGVLDFDFLHQNNKEYTFLSLSSGEREYLNFFTNFSYTLNNPIMITKNWILMLLDEVELSFHPNWQKKIIKNIDDIIKKINPYQKIDVIITSHSPFILSDLPKENVIFLEKVKDTGKCRNSTKDIDINPFGANIHTLLSHGFFMKDGLMGEFAKGKINEIIDFLNNKKTINEISTSQNQIKKVIENIGEDFLKKKLLDMYYKKFDDEFTKKQRKIELLKIQKKIELELKQYD